MPLDCYFFPSGISNPRCSYQQALRLYACTLYHIALLLLLFLHLARGAGGQSRLRQMQLIPGSTLGRVLRFLRLVWQQ